MKKFVVEQAKPGYRVIQNPYMIRLNKRTITTHVEILNSLLSLYADVIGQIIAISDVGNFRTAAGTMQKRRIITLRDVKLPSEVDAVEKIELHDTNATQQPIEQKDVLQLKDMDPFEHMNTRFQCTITITKLSPNQGWYYPACKICNSRSTTIIKLTSAPKILALALKQKTDPTKKSVPRNYYQ
ncbi:hypothetical protein C2845_PM03G15940 [Panicum miliaceum]|uniref:DUF223 domain-containing protein n=1 Tax=Panicum miliaceum TaxID=4540 RepID=A0A3L6T8I2_PANMI|nr:hypothetical protein C2845_PM03G15940 [Panicum miliaceum]